MRLVISAFLVMALATTAFGQITPGDPSSYPSISIATTSHNLNNYPGVQMAGGIPGEQICLPCHTPHNAYPDPNGELDVVLWNHAETQLNFTMYTTLNWTGNPAGPTTGSGPDGPSKMCLSCHDGNTAVDNYGNPFDGTMSGGTVIMEGPRAIGSDGDLTDDHPIGIAYPTNRPAEYADPGSFAPGINGGPGVRLVDIGGVMRVECTSCHEPHNNGLGRFLRAPLQQSWICLQCHIK